MPSTQAIIYDGRGTDATCLTATEKSIKESVDERNIKIQRFSMISDNFGTHESPVSLFVVPGGNYRDMSTDLCLSKAKIHQLVKEHGASYLGICAGAIAASEKPFFSTSQIKIGEVTNVEITPYRGLLNTPFLELYSGKTCYFDATETFRFGTCKVRKEGADTGYHHFFQQGVCFNVGRSRKVEILSRYEEYSFSGKIFDITRKKSKKFSTIVPVSSVTEKVEKGRVLLTGFHPEMDPETLSQRPISADYIPFVQRDISERLNRSVETLRESRTDQQKTMLDYLTRLEIPVKKA